ncbi:lipoprotein intramolecular transacylase Lit [Caldisericum exile]|uniref:TIGR01906 family membrane protein n=1 Tax=Caldisericum exile (strain DSM 21853 / NBRC 104410 / AZM16c01) TaxID=511051 RepID=A0A7U6JEY9_CALEA|nr:DUF1461 domain-containing protein [Caldisericum exile]BAL80943.1 hypothetical protein CSE_08170 [Caldisericum exile AZM16c01]
MIKKTILISITLILILLPLFWILFLNQPIFSLLYDTLHLKDYNNMEKEDYLSKVSIIIHYFFNTKPLLEIKEMSEIEKIHMKDVKFLILLALLILVFALVTVLVFRRELKKIIIREAGIVTLGIVAIIVIFSLINFDFAFIIFHRILFTNNFWLLDPSTLLIKLFPEKVFMVLAYIWFGITLFLSLIITVFVSV